MSDNIFTGCMPALMTPCTAQRKPDFDALVAKGRELIDIGMSAVVYCGSMGDWPLLTDEQRQEGVKRLAKPAFRLSSARVRSTLSLPSAMRRTPPRSAPRA
jgi:dihydrodipicolinate synthase/N-acetylneuraminate lyase